MDLDRLRSGVGSFDFDRRVWLVQFRVPRVCANWPTGGASAGAHLLSVYCDAGVDFFARDRSDRGSGGTDFDRRWLDHFPQNRRTDLSNEK